MLMLKADCMVILKRCVLFTKEQTGQLEKKEVI